MGDSAAFQSILQLAQQQQGNGGAATPGAPGPMTGVMRGRQPRGEIYPDVQAGGTMDPADMLPGKTGKRLGKLGVGKPRTPGAQPGTLQPRTSPPPQSAALNEGSDY
jgi:hypothetical protein